MIIDDVYKNNKKYQEPALHMKNINHEDRRLRKGMSQEIHSHHVFKLIHCFCGIRKGVCGVQTLRMRRSAFASEKFL